MSVARTVVVVAAVIAAVACGEKKTGQQPALPGLPNKIAPMSASFTIADLPDYPGATRVRLESKEEAGGRKLEAKFVTQDALDSVKGYYEVALAASRWQVIERKEEPDEVTWRLARGTSTAKIKLDVGDAGGVTIELEREDR